MKKKVLYLFGFLFCAMLVFTGCTSNSISQFAISGLSGYEYYIQNVPDLSDYIAEKAVSQDKQDLNNLRLVEVLLGLTTTITNEASAMACIDFFETDTTDNVGYYEFGETTIQVEYDTSQRVYNVEVNIQNNDPILNSYTITKTDGIYTVEQIVRAESLPFTVVVEYDSTQSTIFLRANTKLMTGETIIVSREFITLTNGDVITRTIITINRDNNKNIYTIECHKKLFEARMKIVKSKKDIGRINKKTFKLNDFTSPTSEDITGYLYEISSDNTRQIKTHGNINDWDLN